MDILEKIAIPPSANRVMLIKYITTICFVLIVPYLGMLLGSTFLSVFYDGKGKNESNSMFARFARDINRKLTFSRYAGLALGLIPLFSILFGYAQLLYGSNSITIGVMTGSVLLIYIGLVCIYRYRESFVIESVLTSFRNISTAKSEKKEEDAANVEEFESKLMMSNSRLGRIGLTFLFFGLYLFAGSTSLAANPAKWESTKNFLQVLFTVDSSFSMFYILIGAGVITGGAILFFFFEWDGGVKDMDEKYEKFVKGVASKMILGSIILLPFFLFFKFLFVPTAGQAPMLFTYMLVTIILILILANIVYSMVRFSNYRYVTVVYVLIFVVFTFGILNDQIAFSSAISEHLKTVVEKSEELDKEVKSKTVSTTGVDAEAIFNSKCVACHRFDVKLVGPPYQQTVPKYNGDVNQLAEFIYNPIKKNPDFPPMPNQGLKKKEALAMAKWLIEKVSGKK